MFNETVIRQWWEIYHGWEDDPLVEVRVETEKGWLSGYFKDVDTMIREIRRFPKCGIYATVNKIEPACYTRGQCDNIRHPKASTSADDIARRTCLFLDFDPKRPSDTNATDGEKAIAYERMKRVCQFLRSEGFENPVIADSCNGYHCMYHIDVPKGEEGNQLIKDVVGVLSLLFFDDVVKIDKATTDANRLAKIIGTISPKGTDKSTVRPQRESKFIYIPREWKITPIEHLQRVAARMRKNESEPQVTRYGRNRSGVDIDEFIEKHNIEIAKTRTDKDGTKIYTLKQCPFCNHGAPDSAIFRRPNGQNGFLCFHNSCADKTWKDFQLFYDPTSYSQQEYEEYEYRRRYGNERQQYTPPPIVEKVEGTDGPWKTLSQIRRLKPSDYIYIPTGIDTLDKRMYGFALGEVTIFSGTSGAGKSTFLNHFALSAIQSGFKTALWTGELTDSRFLDWFDQVAAGNWNRSVAGYEDFYYTPDNIRDKIHDWIGDRFLLYDNDYGYGSTQIVHDVQKAVEEQHIKLVLLDNLMALDLDETDGSENDKQTRLIKELKNYAKKAQIHIVLVAHPRKEQSFQLLRKESISGTANLTNLADNVLIAHRVRMDFTERAKGFFPQLVLDEWKAKGFSVILEVAKNRNNGVLDLTVGLYYDNRSRRILNADRRYVVYGWEDEPVQQTISIPDPITPPDDDDPFKDNPFE